ncbi:phosphatidylglycerophosphatase A [Halomonas sp. MCCC 1A11036]|uniref:Phosphatidylglycerophosphatase A n=2 Tax=Billgrantia zhangzhouensis TaxID=2733481 RepID=A0ABS9AE33_9GAMM|nr:phosphatidylglycerophosphatase A [Halomonas zhangzhouensis]
MDDAVLLFATGFGLGWLPWSPGTFGSLLGIPLAWWMSGFTRGSQLGIMTFLLIVAVPICHVASLALGSGDAPQIVADEFMAFPIALLGLSVARQPWVMALAFILFRLFDATKPPPIDHIEAIGGGLSIALDDVMAAIYAWLVLVAILSLWRRHGRR